MPGKSIRRRRQSFPTTLLSILCLSSQLSLSSYYSDAFLLSPNTRRLAFLTKTHEDAAAKTKTTIPTTTFAPVGSCTNTINFQSSQHQQFYRHGSRCGPFKSSMTAESETETKVEEDGVHDKNGVQTPETETKIPSSSSSDKHNKVPDADDANGVHVPNELDVPTLTAAGGYTHTTTSRAKISAANKGKVPWNKGKGRSEETKRKIAEGVRRKNRERFLQKLKDMGVTEEEYEQQKKEERRKKDAERRARRTANGGYTPTEETKAKISKILKKKYAEGGVKRKKSSKPARKGFKHSEATRAKISESLRKKWSEDPEYQAKMNKSTGKVSSSRAKISKTLKERWQDPKFRAKMMESMQNRKTRSGPASVAQRKKISEAMKKKWQDAQYRKNAMEGMEKYRDSQPVKPKKPKIRAATIKVEEVTAVTPMTTAKMKKKKSRSKKVQVGSATSLAAKSVKKKKKKKKAVKKKKSTVTLADSATPSDTPVAKTKKKKEKLKDDGDISRMREERRDLYDLLYGDEPGAMDDDDDDDDEDFDVSGVIDITKELEVKDPTDSPSLSFFTGTAQLDDENLDDFDPYNLDDY